MTDERPLSLADEVPADSLGPVVREGVIVAGTLGLVALGTALPGVDRGLPGVPLTGRDVVVGLGVLFVVATMLYAAPLVWRLVAASLEGPQSAVDDVASIAQYTLVFAAVAVAHRGFAPVVLPLIDRPWTYDAAFLIIGTVPLAVIAYRISRSIDPIARSVTARVSGEPADVAPVGREHRT